MNSVAPRIREIRAHIDDDAHEKSYLIGTALLLLFVSIYYSTVVLAVVCSWEYKIPLVLVNGISIGILFIIGHDCCHECFTPGRVMDKIYGRIAFFPALTPFTPWWYGHNYLHHGHTNLRGRDYPWQPISYEEYLQASPGKRWLERTYKTFPGLALNWVVDIWWKHMLFPRSEDWTGMSKRAKTARFDRVLVLLYFISFCVGLTLLCRWLQPDRTFLRVATDVAIFGWFLPYVCWSVLVGALTFVQHTHPETIWFADRDEWSFYGGQLQSTTHIGMPWPLNKVFLNVMEHNAHHVDPSIPLYRLVLQQANLEREYGDDIPCEPFTFRLLFSIMKTCQLYDFENHQWLDFSGHPTTEPALLKTTPGPPTPQRPPLITLPPGTTLPPVETQSPLADSIAPTTD